MLVNSSVTNHLRKYFDLACMHYQEGNLGLAVFFAITVIEECAKILYLRDADIKDVKQRKDVLNHSQKHLVAFINLLTASERFDALSEDWRDLAWSCFSGRQLMQLRNRSLYIWFNNRKELTVPEETISAKEAALLVYLSGFAAVELAEYVDLDETWVNDMLQSTEKFRNEHLVP